MANSTNNGSAISANEAWAEAAAKRKYGVYNGVPYVGAEGHVVPLPAPDWFDAVPEASRGTVFQALAEYIGNRVAQPAAKADNATHEAVVNAAATALTNGYEPTRAREKDPIEAEVDKRFTALVGELVRKQKPEATDAQIAEIADKKAAQPDGQAKKRELKDQIFANGMYAIVRRKGKAGALDVDLEEISF